VADQARSEVQHEAALRRWQNRTPEQRRALAEAGAEGRRRLGTDGHIRAIVARAGKLTPEQISTLRSLLPEPESADEIKQAAAS
jgi:hypothetical protein